jgi:Protein of unknown function (DUF3592)
MVAMRSKRKAGPGEYIAAALIWLLFTGLGVGMSVSGWFSVAESHALHSGLSAPATITSMMVVAHQSRRSTSYEPRVAFQFEHQGQTMTGGRIRPESVSCSTQASASDYLNKLSAQPQTAYFRAAAPTRAVLDWRVGSETALEVFLGSALASGVTLGIAFAIASTRRKFPDDSLPLCTVRTESGYMTMANHGGPARWVLLGYLAAGLATIVTLLILDSPQCDDSTFVLLGSVPVIVAAFAWVLLRKFVPKSGGAVVIDEEQQTVVLLGWAGDMNRPRIVIPFAEISGVGTVLRMRGKNKKHSYSPVLKLLDASGQRDLVLKQVTALEPNINELVAWMHEVLAIEAPAAVA